MAIELNPEEVKCCMWEPNGNRIQFYCSWNSKVEIEAFWDPFSEMIRVERRTDNGYSSSLDTQQYAQGGRPKWDLRLLCALGKHLNVEVGK
jgi:hypothetical protein